MVDFNCKQFEKNPDNHQAVQRFSDTISANNTEQYN